MSPYMRRKRKLLHRLTRVCNHLGRQSIVGRGRLHVLFDLEDSLVRQLKEMKADNPNSTPARRRSNKRRRCAKLPVMSNDALSRVLRQMQNKNLRSVRRVVGKKLGVSSTSV